MRPRIALPLLALLVVTAGCVATDPAGTTTATTATQTQTPTPLPESPPPTTETDVSDTPSSVTSPPSTDCPPYLSVEPAGERRVERADRKLTFEELPPERQREFERALEGDIALESGSEGPWIGSVVRYRGEYYATGVYVC